MIDCKTEKKYRVSRILKKNKRYRVVVPKEEIIVFLCSIIFMHGLTSYWVFSNDKSTVQ